MQNFGTLEGLLTRISAANVVVPHPDKPVLVSVLGVEAMCGRNYHPGGEDGGCTHEVSLTITLFKEQAGQPEKAAFRSCLTVRICRDNSTFSSFLVRSITAVSFPTMAWKLFQNWRSFSCCFDRVGSSIIVSVEQLLKSWSSAAKIIVSILEWKLKTALGLVT